MMSSWAVAAWPLQVVFMQCGHSGQWSPGDGAVFGDGHGDDTLARIGKLSASFIIYNNNSFVHPQTLKYWASNIGALTMESK